MTIAKIGRCTGVADRMYRIDKIEIGLIIHHVDPVEVDPVKTRKRI